jgi:hypothetical protein
MCHFAMIFCIVYWYYQINIEELFSIVFFEHNYNTSRAEATEAIVIKVSIIFTTVPIFDGVVKRSYSNLASN